MAYQNITSWPTNTGFNVNGATLTGSTNTTVHAKSSDTIDDLDSVQMTWHNTGTVIAGFGIDPIQQSYTSLEYGFFCDNTKWKIYESGVKVWDSINFSVYNTSATAKIERNNNYIRYFLNNNLVYTSASQVSNTDTIYIHAMTSGTTNAGQISIQWEDSSGGSSGGSGGSGGSGEGEGGSSGQMYTSAGSTPHNENRPLRIFKSQRSWF